MALKYRHSDLAYLSAFLKESAFDTHETVDASGGYSLSEFELSVSYDHTVRSDSPGAGVEMGFEQYVARKTYTATLTFPFLRPNDLAFLCAFGLGTSTADQDDANTAYEHYSDLATDDDQIPFSLMWSEAGVQQDLTGCTISSFTVSLAGEYWSGTAEIVGTRTATSSDTYPAEISEQPFIASNAKFYTETGANVDITATASVSLEQENISAAAATDISGVVTDFSFTVNNNPKSDMDFLVQNTDDNYCRGQAKRGAKREVYFEWTQTYEAATHLTTLEGAAGVSTHMAMECLHKEEDQGVIDGGAYYFGFSFIITRGRLDAIGSSSDSDGVLTQNLRLTAMTPTDADEGAGSNSQPVMVHIYNAQAAYMG